MSDFDQLIEKQQRVVMRVADALFFNDPHLLDSISMGGDNKELLQQLQASAPMPGVLLSSVHEALKSNPKYIELLNAQVSSPA